MLLSDKVSSTHSPVSWVASVSSVFIISFLSGVLYRQAIYSIYLVVSDPWRISGEERSKHDIQFFQLKPVNGFVTGKLFCLIYLLQSWCFVGLCHKVVLV